MKTAFTFLFSILLTSVLVSAQPRFQKYYGGSGADNCYTILKTSDGGYLLGGETNSFGAGSYDAWLMKTDASGTMSWFRTYGTPQYDWANSVIEVTGGGYVFVGGSEDAAFTGYIVMTKVSSAGLIMWQKKWGESWYNNAYEVEQTSDGGFIVCGTITDDDGEHVNACVIKTDSAGNLQWSKVYRIANSDGYLYSVQQTADGGYILAGEIYTSVSNGLLIKTNSTGNAQWAKSYGGSAVHWFTCVQTTSNGEYVLSGSSSEISNRNMWLARMNATGVPVWSKSYGGPGTAIDNAWWMTKTSDGGYALCGSSTSFTLSFEATLLKTDSVGAMQWGTYYGGVAPDYANQVVQTSNGGYAMAGATQSFGSGGDIYFIRTNATGISGCSESAAAFTQSNNSTTYATVTLIDSGLANLTPPTLATNTPAFFQNTNCLSTGLDEGREELAISIYPNPNHDKLNIDCKTENAELSIYDLTGRKVYEQTLTHQTSVIHHSFAAGVYVARITGAGMSANVRFVVE